MKNYGTWKEEKLFQEDHLSIQLEQPDFSFKIKEFKEKFHFSDVLVRMKKDKHLKILLKKTVSTDISVKMIQK
jgi:hypothetical protein